MDQAAASATETTQAQATSGPTREQIIEKLRSEQNLPFAAVAGIAAAFVGAILWAIITVSTEYQIGFMAIAVGIMVGYAIKEAGKGIDKTFSYLGAVCGLLGCVVGNILSVVGFFAKAKGVGYFDALAAMNVDLISSLMATFFQPMDLLFYAIAVYEGYKLSIKYKVLDE